MKRNILLTFLILTIFLGNATLVYAEGQSAGEVGGNSGGTSDSTAEWKWVWPGTIHGIKITVYNKSTGEALKEVAFVNNEDEKNSLNNQTILVKTSNEERLVMNKEAGFWSDAGSSYFKYLNFDDYIDKKTKIDIVAALKSNSEEEIYSKLDLSNINYDPNNLVLVIEPATTLKKKDGDVTYFGTYWEFMYMYDTMTGSNSFHYVFYPFFRPDTANNVFGGNLKIPKGVVTQTNPETSEIWEFLSLPKFSKFKQTVATKDSLGVAIILLTDIIPQGPNEKKCETKITKGSCNTDFLVQEPTDRDCVINHPKYQYKAVGDCGIIYCSEKISTDLDDFYKTFTPIIRSGSYFKMNNVKVDVTRTCYFYSFYNNSSCNNWHNNITEENAGTIGLSLVSDYTLVKDSNTSNFSVNCNSYSNGKCTKATAVQHVEYVLEPNINRYISIKEMAGILEPSGIDVYDLGGEHLTTPISLSTGNHNYEIDYQNAGILTDSIGRLVNKEIGLDKQNLVLKYSYNHPLTLDDLKYSCAYTAKSDRDVCPSNQCCDGDGIVPCPCVCDSVTGCDENCVPNPPECDCGGDCCDSKCNVIDCPNPDDEPGGFPNVVYRPINLEEGFPGEDGIGRDPGSNWYGYVYDQDGNTINKPNGAPYTKEEYYINFNRGYNDYDIYHSEPLYVIKLDYDTLKYIREYNEFTNHDYNDIKLKCNNGQDCRSFFLRGIVDQTDPKFNRNLITDGSCKIFENCF